MLVSELKAVLNDMDDDAYVAIDGSDVAHIRITSRYSDYPKGLIAIESDDNYIVDGDTVIWVSQ